MPIVKLVPDQPLELGPAPPNDPYIISNPNDAEGSYELATETLSVLYHLAPESQHKFNVGQETTITNLGPGNLNLQTPGL